MNDLSHYPLDTSLKNIQRQFTSCDTLAIQQDHKLNLDRIGMKLVKNKWSAVLFNRFMHSDFNLKACNSIHRHLKLPISLTARDLIICISVVVKCYWKKKDFSIKI